MKAKVNLIKSLSVAFVLCFVLALMPLFGSFNSAKAETSVTIAGQTVDMSSFETYNGASIRYDAENKGLRFVTGISQVAFGQLNTLAEENGYTVKYGTIVTYSYRVQKCIDAGKDFTKVALDETIETSGSKYVDFGVNVFRENPEVAGNVEFTAVLGIQESNYNIPMSARGYVVISDGENEEIYYANYEILNSTAENISHTLLEDFISYGVDSDTKLAAIAEYTKNETKDGFFMESASAMRPFKNNSADVLIEENQSIGGRAGVTKYTLKTANKGWAERLTPTFVADISWTGIGNSAWHSNSINRQKTMGFKYVLFDIYLQSAFDIYFPTSTGLHAYVKVSTAGNLIYRERYINADENIAARDTTDETFTSKVKVYNMAGNQVTATYSGLWYTVAVDISCNLEMSSNSAVETALSFNGVNSGVYFDNIRYYRTNAWESSIVKTSQEMDDSAFGIMLDKGQYDTFGIGSFGGRDNVVRFYEKNPGNDNLSRVGFMFTNNWDEAGNSMGKTAHEKIKNSGVKYISFDICRGNNAPISLYLWDNAYTGNPVLSNKSAPFTIVYNTGAIGKQPSNIKLYDMSGNETTTMVANTWYTIVIEVQYDVTNTNWSAISFNAAWTNIGIDNIVYYYNAVPTLWK